MKDESFELIFSLPEISQAANQFREWSQPDRIFTFSGSLGAGKTTFIHALCDAMGVEDPVSSPTFALINEYQFHSKSGNQRILHMDWYRLRNTDEAVDAGMEDALSTRDVYCFVEWPEKAEELLSMPHIQVLIQCREDHERMLTATRLLG